jgi:hypothetical protein
VSFAGFIPSNASAAYINLTVAGAADTDQGLAGVFPFSLGSIAAGGYFYGSANAGAQAPMSVRATAPLASATLFPGRSWVMLTSTSVWYQMFQVTGTGSTTSIRIHGAAMPR